MTLLHDFLAIAKGMIVQIAVPFVDGYIVGRVEIFDDRHLVLKCNEGLSLLNIDDIGGISLFAQAEIIEPIPE